MKILLTFKTPDIEDQIEAGDLESYSQTCKVIEKFVRNGEYISIEIDTDTGKATVLPVVN